VTAPGQEQVWWFDRLTPDALFHHIPLLARVDGPLDVVALRRAITAVVVRHEPLRTAFVQRDDELVALPAAEPFGPITVHDISARPESDRAAAADLLVRETIRARFDLAAGPLWRCVVIRLGAREHVLALVIHHIATDGYSLLVLQRELVDAYAAAVAGRPPAFPPLRSTYRDFAAGQRNRTTDDLDHWRRTLAEPPEPAVLPFGHGRSTPPTYDADTVDLVVPAGLADRVASLASARRCSPFMVLLAAFVGLLHRYTGDTDLIVGTPSSGRPPGGDDVVGYLVTMLALRVRFDADPTGDDLLSAVREASLDAFAHRDTPFLDVVRAVALRRVPGVHPLFQFVFAAPPALGTRRAGDTTFEFREGHSGHALYDLEFQLPDASGERAGFVKYRTGLFERAHVEAMADEYLRLLRALVDEPDRHVADHRLRQPAQRERAVVAWNATGREYPRTRSLSDLFEEHADATPAAPAVRYGDTTLTYRELDERANRFGHYLRSLGVGPGSRVALCLPRSVDWVVCALGVIKAGAAYVPLDPTYPPQRLAAMAADADPLVLVTREPWAAGTAAHVVALDDVPDDGPADRLGALPGGADTVAYLMYTSGSTGRPKGVAVTHRNIVRLVRNTGYVEFRAGDRIAQASNVSFDAATFELWGALLNGAELVGLDRDDVLDGARLGRRLRDLRIDVLFLTTSLAMQLAMTHPDATATLRYLVFGGEQPDGRAVRELIARGGPRLVNGYGPTETTTFAGTHECRDADDTEPVPLGRPIGDTSLYVLDGAGEPVLPGVAGELYVGGDAVALGYFGEPGATAERFVPDHLGGRSGARLYRSGDRARYRADGVIEFLGRLDRQVKIRGFRVEPAEVEACLGRSDLVRHAVVRVWRDGDDAALVAYVVPATDLEAVREYLRAELPAHLVPTVVGVPALPLTQNGKLDVAALPDPAGYRKAAGSAPPATPTEHLVADVWCAVLGVASVGRGDDFFQLGGHSLKVVGVASRVAAAAGVDVPPGLLFERPTLAGFAAAVDELPSRPAIPAPTAAALPTRDVGDLLDELDALSDAGVARLADPGRTDPR
jgi:amino acid adenylation domain-containing protein